VYKEGGRYVKLGLPFSNVLHAHIPSMVSMGCTSAKHEGDNGGR